MQSQLHGPGQESYGLQQEFITPYSPEQNGMVERVIKTLHLPRNYWTEEFGQVRGILYLRVIQVFEGTSNPKNPIRTTRATRISGALLSEISRKSRA